MFTPGLMPGSLLPVHDDNPTTHFSFVTLLLIALNVLVFLVEPNLGQFRECQGEPTCEQGNLTTARFICRFGIVPTEITGQKITEPALCSLGEVRSESKSIPWSALTSMFLHGGFQHLFGNMLFLWVFGNNIEDVLGKVRYVLFYLLAGLVASAAHIFANAGSDIATIGASGAVAGLLGAYIVLFPRARITTLAFIFFFRIPAVVVLGLWFASQFLIGRGQQVGGGVAWMAHVGGFVAGAVLIFIFGGLKRRQQPARYTG
ncbi:MAG: rhomboid family intramembrane serine protease [Actinomycetota bacterium]